MLVKGIIGLLVGSIVGFVISSIFRKLGGVCPVICNSIISIIYFGILGFIIMIGRK